MLALLFVSLFVMLFMGAPVYVALSFSSLIVLIVGGEISPMVAAQRAFAGIDKFALLAMPLFIFAAELMKTSGLAKRLLDFSNSAIGFMRGGMALTTQLACMFFGALSGSSPATVAAIGGLMYPELTEKGYDKNFSLGLVCTSGAVALLIPPSVLLIIYGSVTGASVGALFIGGIGAGLAMGAVVLIYSYYHAVKSGRKADSKFSIAEIKRTGKKAAWTLGVPIIILGGIYAGIFTPTESAAVATVYTIFVGMIIYKDTKISDIIRTAKDTTASLASVMLVVASASIFGWVLTVYEAPQMITESLLGGGNISQFHFWMVSNVLFLIAGMFMDGVAAITIMAPLIYPVAMSLGINPIHLGVVITANLAIGQYTPPFGLNLFVASSMTKKPMTELIPAIVPFVGITILILLVITYVPDVSMYLVKAVYPEMFK